RATRQERARIPGWPPQPREILVHVAGKTIGDVTRQIGIPGRQFAETEIRIIKRAHQLAHILDALPEHSGVLAETFGREVPRQKSLMNFIARQYAALEGQHYTG